MASGNIDYSEMKYFDVRILIGSQRDGMLC